MKRNEIILLCILFLTAFCLRVYDVSYPVFRWSDENAHVPAAVNYWNNGQSEPDNWEHPPLRHILLYGFLRVFGDNAYGWRMRNVLFGAFAVVLTYLFCREISGSRKTAFFAGMLLATDPLHVVLSRFTWEEIYGGAFFLAALVLYLKHNRRRSWLVLSAIFMGCALATKWYYVPCWLLICLVSLYENDNYRTIETTLFILSTYLLIPLGVFIISYYPWFGRGYSFSEFGEYIVNAYYSLQGYRLQHYNPRLLFKIHASAGEWFIRPIIIGQGAFLNEGQGEFLVYMNNIPIWGMTIPAMIGMAVLAVRKRSLAVALPVLIFCSTYMLFLFVRRPAFLYSAVPLLPFAFTAIAYGLAQLMDKYNAKLYYIALVGVVLWSLYLYPLVTSKKVPVASYWYILHNYDVKII